MSDQLLAQNRFRGVLLGTAVGDSLGLPVEGLSRRRVQKICGGEWRHRLLFGRGMLSDDTEHSIFVAQALLENSQSPSAFAHSLSWKLRWWLLGLPAGIGFATLRSILKLWLGSNAEQSGVRSAGNGAAMRSAIIGAYFATSPEDTRAFVRASTRITHTDPRAFTGSLAVATLAAWAMNRTEPLDSKEVFELLRTIGNDGDDEWKKVVDNMQSALQTQLSVEDFAKQMNLERGIGGYIYHSVPVAIYSWLRHYGNFRETLVAALNCGGDTDTVGTIAGALAGAVVSEKGIPKEWIEGIWDWPRNTTLLGKISDRLAAQIETGKTQGRVRYFWPAVLLRNALFICAILVHGLRRLLPPY